MTLKVTVRTENWPRDGEDEKLLAVVEDLLLAQRRGCAPGPLNATQLLNIYRFKWPRSHPLRRALNDLLMQAGFKQHKTGSKTSWAVPLLPLAEIDKRCDAWGHPRVLSR